MLGDQMYSFYSYKKKKPYGVIFTIILCVIITGVSGFFIYKNLSEPLRENINVKSIPQDSDPVSTNIPPSPVRYSENTVFNLTKSYVCGHEFKSVEKIPKSFIGKTIDEIISMQYEYEIISYDNSSITAIMYTKTECDSHFIIKLNGNTLIAYNKLKPQEIIKKADINLYEYYEEDIKILSNGIEVTSTNELLEFFEDFA